MKGRQRKPTFASVVTAFSSKKLRPRDITVENALRLLDEDDITVRMSINDRCADCGDLVQNTFPIVDYDELSGEISQMCPNCNTVIRLATFAEDRGQYHDGGVRDFDDDDDACEPWFSEGRPTFNSCRSYDSEVFDEITDWVDTSTYLSFQNCTDDDHETCVPWFDGGNPSFYDNYINKQHSIDETYDWINYNIPKCDDGHCSGGLVSERRTRISSLDSLLPGDHVAWHRPYVIWHHGIVTDVKPNDNSLVITSNTNNGADHGLSLGGIREEVIQVDFDADELYRYEYADGEYFPVDDVIARARSHIGENKYNLFTNNCEHFARWCKAGQKHSVQVKTFVNRIRRTLATAGNLGAIGINVLIEALYLGYECLKLFKRRQSGKIDVADCRQELAKICCESIGGLVCSVAVRLVLLAIRIPFLAIVCSIVGSIIGRIIGAIIGKTLFKPNIKSKVSCCFDEGGHEVIIGCNDFNSAVEKEVDTTDNHVGGTRNESIRTQYRVTCSDDSYEETSEPWFSEGKPTYDCVYCGSSKCRHFQETDDTGEPWFSSGGPKPVYEYNEW